MGFNVSIIQVPFNRKKRKVYLLIKAHTWKINSIPGWIRYFSSLIFVILVFCLDFKFNCILLNQTNTHYTSTLQINHNNLKVISSLMQIQFQTQSFMLLHETAKSSVFLTLYASIIILCSRFTVVIYMYEPARYRFLFEYEEPLIYFYLLGFILDHFHVSVSWV